jgi:putative alpha-1,2-mannosidase
MRPRLVDGTWLRPFDVWLALPKQNTWGQSGFQYGFEEGNTTQWSFMLPFDFPEEFAAMGGDDEVMARLDRFFCKQPAPVSASCFTAANEDDFVTPYAYVFAGAPWKTQEVVPRFVESAFKTTPDGLPGNDDLGATSGLYVWNALGFYPVVPGVGGVVLGTPMFKKAVLRLGDGRTLNIEGAGEGFYVQKVSLNGAPYSGTWLPISSLQSGTTDLQFTLGPQPNKERGTSVADRPPSFRQP